MPRARAASSGRSVGGGLGRASLTSLLFTFALFEAAREQWDAYDDDGDANANATAATAAADNATAVAT